MTSTLTTQNIACFTRNYDSSKHSNRSIQHFPQGTTCLQSMPPVDYHIPNQYLLHLEHFYAVIR